MSRERALQVLLVVVGAIFLAAALPLSLSLLAVDRLSPAEEMILSMYIPAGFYLLLAVRDPPAQRTLIQCLGWLNLAHAAVMVLEVLQGRGEPGQLPFATVLGIVSLVLIALPPRQRTGSPLARAGSAPRAEIAAGSEVR